MNKRIFLTALVCAVLVSNSALYAFKSVSMERVEQKKEQMKSRIYYTKVARVAAAVTLLGIGGYMVKTSFFDTPIGLPEPWKMVSDVLEQQKKLTLSLESAASEYAALLPKKSIPSFFGRCSNFLSSGVSWITSSVVNMLPFVTLGVVAKIVGSYVDSSANALLSYPGSAFNFYTVHARVPEILNEYARYAEILAEAHMHDIEDVEYASLYFLHECDEIIYRIEQLIAYILIMGEESVDMKEDSEFLVKQLIRRTDKLVCDLHACGMGNCPDDMVKKVKAFEAELTTTIRLCNKKF